MVPASGKRDKAIWAQHFPVGLLIEAQLTLVTGDGGLEQLDDVNKAPRMGLLWTPPLAEWDSHQVESACVILLEVGCMLGY